jgi:hypothetical protein
MTPLEQFEIELIEEYKICREQAYEYKQLEMFESSRIAQGQANILNWAINRLSLYTKPKEPKNDN